MDEALRGDARTAAVERIVRSSIADGELIGAWIARQRVLRGISIDELERRTRIPRRSLERLESGVFDGDRDAFARGFVRTVAFAIGLDADEAVARMLPEFAVRPRSPRRVRAGRIVRGVLVVMIVSAVLGLLGLAWQHGVRAWPADAVVPHPAREIVHRRDALLELALQARHEALRPPDPLPGWLVAPEPWTRIDAWPEPASTPARRADVPVPARHAGVPGSTRNADVSGSTRNADVPGAGSAIAPEAPARATSRASGASDAERPSAVDPNAGADAAVDAPMESAPRSPGDG